MTVIAVIGVFRSLIGVFGPLIGVFCSYQRVEVEVVHLVPPDQRIRLALWQSQALDNYDVLQGLLLVPHFQLVLAMAQLLHFQL